MCANTQTHSNTRKRKSVYPCAENSFSFYPFTFALRRCNERALAAPAQQLTKKRRKTGKRIY